MLNVQTRLAKRDEPIPGPCVAPTPIGLTLSTVFSEWLQANNVYNQTNINQPPTIQARPLGSQCHLETTVRLGTTSRCDGLELSGRFASQSVRKDTAIGAPIGENGT